jgi:hypothetical protein
MRKPNNKPRNPKEKGNDHLWPEKVKIARLYTSGKLKGKTFENLENLDQDLKS